MSGALRTYFSEVLPTDVTLQKYVRRAPDMYSALAQVRGHAAAHPPEITFLIDPLLTIERAHRGLERLRHMLERAPREIGESEGAKLLRERDNVADLLIPISGQPSRSRIDVVP